MIEFYPNSIYYPREAVEEKISRGELDQTKEHLFNWTKRHFNEIWECAKEDSENPSDEILLDNLRAVLLCKGSLQPAADLADMIKEITKEVWYRNETETEPAEQVESEWRTKYQTKWRQAKLFEAFVLIEKNANQLIAILREK